MANMTEELAKELSKFTTDENLTIDQFIVFKDLTIEAKTKMQRLKDLKDKTFLTNEEKTEITTLMADLIEYMPTSTDWNKFVACIMTMQMYMRDEIVIFVNQKQQEITDFVNVKKTEFQQLVEQFSNKGDYNTLITYKVGNTIRYGGYGFICIKENLNQSPIVDHDTEYWVKFTLKGDKGDPSLNVNYKGVYVNTTTYNLGDAVSYTVGDTEIMYYCKANGTVGILPTNTTKWSYEGGIVTSTATPSDTHVFWWDKNINIETLKRYNGVEWVGVRLNGKTAITVLNTDEKVDLAKAINEVNTKCSTNIASINNVKNKTDLLGEDINQKLTYRGLKVGETEANKINLSAINGLTASNVQDGIAQTLAKANSAFQSASDGKTYITGKIGNTNVNNTFVQIGDEVQNCKNILASNLVNKGVSASSGNNLRNLVGLAGNITLASMGGKRFASGTTKPIPDGIVTESAKYDIAYVGFYQLKVTGIGFLPKYIIATSQYTESDMFITIIFPPGTDHWYTTGYTAKITRTNGDLNEEGCYNIKADKQGFYVTNNSFNIPVANQIPYNWIAIGD